MFTTPYKDVGRVRLRPADDTKNDPHLDVDQVARSQSNEGHKGSRNSQNDQGLVSIISNLNPEEKNNNTTTHVILSLPLNTVCLRPRVGEEARSAGVSPPLHMRTQAPCCPTHAHLHLQSIGSRPKMQVSPGAHRSLVHMRTQKSPMSAAPHPPPCEGPATGSSGCSGSRRTAAARGEGEQ